MSTVEGWLPAFAGDGQVRYYSLARHALVEALRLAGVRKGSSVLLPEFLCRDLLAPLHILGAKPYWYEVAPDMTPATNPVEWPVANAVLAVNYFGFPQNLLPFLTYAERTGAVLIEDNAHGYLSRDQDGNWLGCRTGLGIFSLRKTMRVPDGAALWVGSSYPVGGLPVQGAFDGTGVNVAQLYKARLRGLPLVGEMAYRLSTRLVREIRRWQAKNHSSVSDLSSEKALLVPGNPWVSLLSALAACDAPLEIERRRTAYNFCANFGHRLGAIPVFAALPLNCAPYAYAFRGDAYALAGMRRYALSQGFDLVSWPDLPSEVVGRAPPHYRNVFLVNFLW